MRSLRTPGSPKVLIFVIALVIITVFSWKSCSNFVNKLELNQTQSEASVVFE